MKNIIFKFIFILLIIIFIIIIVNIFSLYFKSSSPKTGSKTTSKSGPSKTVSVSPPPYISPKVAPPVEAQIGTVTDVSKKPDGKVELIVDKKTYLFQASQKVSLYTSKTASDSVSINQLKKGIMINVIRFTKPDRYEVIGVTDKSLVEKLL